MRRLIFLLALVSTVLSASAQLGMKKNRVAVKTPEAIATAVTSNLGTALILKDDQKTKISALVVESVKQVRAIKLQKIDENAKKASITKLAKDHATKLRALLTADQLKKLDALKLKAGQIKSSSVIPAEDPAVAELRQVLD